MNTRINELISQINGNNTLIIKIANEEIVQYISVYNNLKFIILTPISNDNQLLEFMSFCEVSEKISELNIEKYIISDIKIGDVDTLNLIANNLKNE